LFLIERVLILRYTFSAFGIIITNMKT
jgi:hypothetical protein